MVAALNVLVLGFGIVALCLIARHYTFFKRAEGHELALRMALVFLSQLVNILAILVGKMADWSGAVIIPAIHAATTVIQLFAVIFSCWASFHLYGIYRKYKDDFPKG